MIGAGKKKISCRMLISSVFLIAMPTSGSVKSLWKFARPTNGL